MSTKERVVLIHSYQNAIIGTTLRYPNEVTDLSRFPELKDLPEAGEEELALFTQIVDNLTVDLERSVFHVLRLYVEVRRKLWICFATSYREERPLVYLSSKIRGSIYFATIPDLVLDLKNSCKTIREYLKEILPLFPSFNSCDCHSR